MSNWPIVAATRTETLGAATGDGATITTGAANTKGSYATIGTAGFRWDGFLLQLQCGGSADRFRVDVAINTGGSDQIIVEDYFVDIAVSNSIGIAELLPVKVPSGATVKVRAQAAGAGRTPVVLLTGYAQDFPGRPGYRALVSLTDWTSTLPTNTVVQTGQTFTAWTQICASTSRRVAELLAAATGAGDTTRTASDWICEIGIGGAGSERALVTLLGKNNTSTMFGGRSRIPCDIPAASRLSFRCQCSAAGAADSIAVAAMGLAA